MTLDLNQRRRLHRALSDTLVDILPEPEGIARRIKSVDPVLLERLFFGEVAPVCHGNLLNPAPTARAVSNET